MGLRYMRMHRLWLLKWRRYFKRSMATTISLLSGLRACLCFAVLLLLHGDLQHGASQRYHIAHTTLYDTASTATVASFFALSRPTWDKPICVAACSCTEAMIVCLCAAPRLSCRRENTL
jgi:hypothetical protein